MIRRTGLTGVTANTLVGTPTNGYRWRILGAVVVLNGSATVGARSANLNIGRDNYNGTQTYANETVAITTQGSTSASTTTQGIGTVSPAGAATTVTQWSQFPEVTSFDTLYLSVSLQSGDTVDVFVVYEEVPDE